jgi:hypothetical protein
MKLEDLIELRIVGVTGPCKIIGRPLFPSGLQTDDI